MAIRNIFKLSRKTFVDPMGWLGWGMLQDQHQVIKSSLRTLLSKPPKASDQDESFKEVAHRLGLKQKDIQARITLFRRYVFLFCTLGVLVFLYGFHFLFLGHVYAWLLGMATTILFLSQAFKFHFWAFQLRTHRLDVNFQDWKKDLLS